MADVDSQFGDARTAVHIRPGAADQVGHLLVEHLIGTSPGRVLVVTDNVVASLHAEPMVESLRRADLWVHVHQIPAGEASKSLAELERLYRRLAANGMGRDGVILAIGGGVVSDLAGFVAATWMRGIRWTICPTTMEADVDAAIGGKTAINVAGGKNLVGAFHQPRLVVMDPLLLGTLPVRDVRAGLAESIKHALIADEAFLAWHESHAADILALEPAVTTELIRTNVRIKADFVSRDMVETEDVRIMLNFGHTIGHAVESASDYRLRHGECVGLGMLAACRLSEGLGLCESTLLSRVDRLLTQFGLPTNAPEWIDQSDVMDGLRLDKKARAGQNRFVLLSAPGHPIVRDDVPSSLVSDAVASLWPAGEETVTP